jgi:hypothetical protein
MFKGFGLKQDDYNGSFFSMIETNDQFRDILISGWIANKIESGNLTHEVSFEDRMVKITLGKVG